MENNEYQLICCGSRGSRPVEGRLFNEFGGFTSCYVLKSQDYALIIDCGTGLYEANAIVLDCSVIDVVITHMHYDHILGMLDWGSLPPKAKITFYSCFDNWFGEKTFEEFFRAPFWPVNPGFTLKETPRNGEPLILREGLKAEFYEASHPNGSQLMRIVSTDENGDHCIVVMFDCENPEIMDINIVKNCDYLLFDGMYTDSEYKTHTGFGHSTWQEACRYASRVNCKRLVVTHHNPGRTDDQLRKFEKLARNVYPDTDFARSGQDWSFPLKDVSTPQEQPAKKHKKKFAFSKITENILDELDDIVLNDEKRLRFLGIGCYVLLSAISLFMSVINIITDKTLLMYSTVVFGVACLINIMLQVTLKIDYKIVQIIFQIEIMLLFCFFLISGEPEGFAALWILMLPFAGMLVFGKRRTLLMCSVMLLLIIFFLDTQLGQSFLQYEYTASFRLRFPMATFAFTMLGYFLELVRERTFKELEALRASQADIIANQTSELREKNFNMMRMNSKLQLRNRILRKTIGETLTDDKIKDMLNEEDSLEDSSEDTKDQ